MSPASGGAVIEVPPALLAERERQSGEAGRRWVAALPALVTRLCREFALDLEDRPLRHGANAVVIEVRRGGEPCVLKVSSHAATVAEEAIALDAWDGQGAVRLLAARPPTVWLWGLPLGLTDDPARCRRLLEVVRSLPLWQRIR